MRLSGVAIFFLVGLRILGAEDAPDPADPVVEQQEEVAPEEGAPIDGVEGEEAAVELPNPPAPEDRALEGWPGVLPELEASEEVQRWEAYVAQGQPDFMEDLAPFEPGLAPVTQSMFAPPLANGSIIQNELLPTGIIGPTVDQGFRFGAGIQVSHDSNIFLTDGNELSDIILTLSPSMDYRSAPPGVPGLVTLQYTPYFRMYMDETDLNTIDHAFTSTVSYNGARGSVEFRGNYGQFSNTNRYTGGLVETENFAASLSGEYRVGSRTRLEASWNGSYSADSDVQGSTTVGQDADTRTSVFEVGGKWEATPMTSIGPSMRYSTNSSATSSDRDSLAFLVNVDHTIRDAFSVSASAGIERVDNGEGSTDSEFTGSLSANYRLNDRLAFQGELGYAAIPQGNIEASRSGGGAQSLNGGVSLVYNPNALWVFSCGVTLDSFPSASFADSAISDQTYTAAVTRILTEGSISLRGSYSMSEYDAIGTAMPGLEEDSDFRSLSLSYQRPVLVGKGNVNASLQWSDSTGEREWNRVQASLGLNVGF